MRFNAGGSDGRIPLRLWRQCSVQCGCVYGICCTGGNQGRSGSHRQGRHRSSAYTGDGIALAKKVGAFLDYDSFVLRLMGPLAMMPGQTISSMSNHPYALEANLNGKRWTCEPSQARMGVFRSGHLLAEQPEGISYVVFDQNTMEAAAKEAKEHPGTGYGGFFGHPSFPENPMADLMDTIAGKAKMPFGPPRTESPRRLPRARKRRKA